MDKRPESAFSPLALEAARGIYKAVLARADMVGGVRVLFSEDFTLKLITPASYWNAAMVTDVTELLRNKRHHVSLHFYSNANADGDRVLTVKFTRKEV